LKSGVATPSNLHQPATGQSGRRGGKVGNSSHPGQSDDRIKSSPQGKMMKIDAPEGRELFYRILLLSTAYF
jgi:hypothetical protein